MLHALESLIQKTTYGNHVHQSKPIDFSMIIHILKVMHVLECFIRSQPLETSNPSILQQVEIQTPKYITILRFQCS